MNKAAGTYAGVVVDVPMVGVNAADRGERSAHTQGKLIRWFEASNQAMTDTARLETLNRSYERMGFPEAGGF